jgi:transcriptional regulator with XRE-family HTH domain
MPTYARNIGKGIRMLRQEHGLTQSQLAASLNTRRSYISTIERGVAIPSILTIERIAAVLDLENGGVLLVLRRMQRISDRAQIKTL